MDSGYDDTNNPFASIPEEYTKKKEEQLAKNTVKRMSADQRQINKVGKEREMRNGCSLHYTYTCTYNVHV